MRGQNAFKNCNRRLVEKIEQSVRNDYNILKCIQYFEIYFKMFLYVFRLLRFLFFFLNFVSESVAGDKWFCMERL